MSLLGKVVSLKDVIKFSHNFEDVKHLTMGADIIYKDLSDNKI